MWIHVFSLKCIKCNDNFYVFCMGNALVVGIPHEIGKAIARRHNQ